MRFRYALYVLLLLLGIVGWIVSLNPRWSPWYCMRHSGRYSYAWSRGTECERVGCTVQKLKEFTIPNTVDADGFTYRCVKP